ncbi:Helix-turn-helix [Natronincola peptidivorans]|uniref:Helix-turn-helix n=1 Tax=Natronincola peptidivorans TaxID=426128 RepID=A0A1I0C6X6_9FIRM|nr:helix-turn-helix transcriptional regulator [Natronincola peptidivorans]SET15301.1 Helix-turn-helix [Natronincola peptidivorans]
MNQKTLQHYRRNKDYTQEYMARKLGVSISSYNLYENGGRRIPHEAAMKIIKLLEIQDWQDIFLPHSFTLREFSEGSNSPHCHNERFFLQTEE